MAVFPHLWHGASLTRIDDPLHDREVGAADSTQDITRIDDTRIAAVRPLISPALLQDELPVSDEIQTLVERSRTEIADVLHGRDDCLIIVVGPCSIHDHGQAMQYARLLRAAADQHRQDLLIVMRVYFEKPRTTVGWKGYIMTRAWTAASASTKACAARASCCWTSAAWACRSPPNLWTCSARSTSPT